MQFILNVGNTHTLIGNADGQLMRQLSTADLGQDALAEIGKGDTIFAGCVVPGLRERLAARYGERINY